MAGQPVCYQLIKDIKGEQDLFCYSAHQADAAVTPGIHSFWHKPPPPPLANIIGPSLPPCPVPSSHAQAESVLHTDVRSTTVPNSHLCGRRPPPLLGRGVSCTCGERRAPRGGYPGEWLAGGHIVTTLGKSDVAVLRGVMTHSPVPENSTVPHAALQHETPSSIRAP